MLTLRSRLPVAAESDRGGGDAGQGDEAGKQPEGVGRGPSTRGAMGLAQPTVRSANHAAAATPMSAAPAMRNGP